MASLRAYLLAQVASDPALSELKIQTPPQAAPHIVSITLPSIRSETMLHYLSAKGIYVSSGSACSSHDTQLSHALLAYGLTPKEAESTIRVSFCPQNTKEDVDTLLDGLAAGLSTLVRSR